MSSWYFSLISGFSLLRSDLAVFVWKAIRGSGKSEGKKSVCLGMMMWAKAEGLVMVATATRPRALPVGVIVTVVSGSIGIGKRSGNSGS